MRLFNVECFIILVIACFKDLNILFFFRILHLLYHSYFQLGTNVDSGFNLVVHRPAEEEAQINRDDQREVTAVVTNAAPIPASVTTSFNPGHQSILATSGIHQSPEGGNHQTNFDESYEGMETVAPNTSYSRGFLEDTTARKDEMTSPTNTEPSTLAAGEETMGDTVTPSVAVITTPGMWGENSFTPETISSTST